MGLTIFVVVIGSLVVSAAGAIRGDQNEHNSKDNIKPESIIDLISNVTYASWLERGNIPSTSVTDSKVKSTHDKFKIETLISPVPIYQFFSGIYHFYTASYSEGVGAGYTYQGLKINSIIKFTTIL